MLTVCSLFFGCLEGGASSAPDNGVDSGSTDVEGPAVCTALRNVGAEVTSQVKPTDAPAATGGAITDGIYVLESHESYTGKGGESGAGSKRKMTLRVSGSNLELVSGEARSRMTIAVENTTLVLDLVCPNTKRSRVGYSATVTTLRLHLPDDDGTQVLSFVRR